MFENKKIVLSGSIKFSDEMENIKDRLEVSNNNVLAYPVKNNDKEYTEVLNSFYTGIDNTDVLLVINKEKNGIAGYIGSSTFSEINHAALNRIMYGKEIDIYLLNEVDNKSSCYDEIKYFIDKGIVKVCNEEQKRNLYI